jgi:protein DGCR14
MTPVIGAETPSSTVTNTVPAAAAATTLNSSTAPAVTLDTFLSLNTSEDNASFDEILNRTNDRIRERHQWMYDTERRERQHLAELNGADALIESASMQPSLIAWDYRARNMLMFHGHDALPLSDAEVRELAAAPQRQVMVGNTRFDAEQRAALERQIELAATTKQLPAAPSTLSTEVELLHARRQELLSSTHLDLDQVRRNRADAPPLEGREPTVRGYGFVSTPVHAPGVEQSPIITWGAVEGTPLLVRDGPDTTTAVSGLNAAALTSGPSFSLKPSTRRERVAHQLAVSRTTERLKEHRDPAAELLAQSPLRRAPATPRIGTTPSPPLPSVQPLLGVAPPPGLLPAPSMPPGYVPPPSSTGGATSSSSSSRPMLPPLHASLHSTIQSIKPPRTPKLKTDFQLRASYGTPVGGSQGAFASSTPTPSPRFDSKSATPLSTASIRKK